MALAKRALKSALGSVSRVSASFADIQSALRSSVARLKHWGFGSGLAARFDAAFLFSTRRAFPHSACCTACGTSRAAAPGRAGGLRGHARASRGVGARTRGPFTRTTVSRRTTRLERTARTATIDFAAGSRPESVRIGRLPLRSGRSATTARIKRTPLSSTDAARRRRRKVDRARTNPNSHAARRRRRRADGER